MNAKRGLRAVVGLCALAIALCSTLALSQAKPAAPQPRDGRGHLEVLSLRLYNAQSGQWSLNSAVNGSGSLNQPSIGEFVNGRGEFLDQEMYNGRAILVRFVISDVTRTSCRFEQSFSADGGKTWEVNWIATDTRA